MSDTKDLSKLKLAELKKLCKEHNISSSGTKVELISRLSDRPGSPYTLLQPGEEDKLLGDDDVDEQPPPLDATLSPISKHPAVTPSQATSDVDSPVTSPSKRLKLDGDSKKQQSSPERIVPSGEALVVKDDDNSTTITTKPTSQLDQSERLANRAVRFNSSSLGGGPLSDDKLAARARRFGLPVDPSSSPVKNSSSSGNQEDLAEKLRRRAERFGIAPASSTVIDVDRGQNSSLNSSIGSTEQQQRKAARLARFGGGGDPSSAVTPNTNNVVSAAVDGGGDDDKEEQERRKAARLAKFGPITGPTTVNSNTAVAVDPDKLAQRKARFGSAA